MAIQVPTADQIREWPATVDVPTAGSALGLGRDASYGLARQGQLPFPVLPLGRALRVTRSSILAALGIPETAPAAPSNALATGPFAQVVGSASEDRSEARTTQKAA
jgi:hypothetical protein